MLKLFLFSALFMISLYMLYCLDKDLYRRFKSPLIILFIVIDTIVMVELTFPDMPFFGFVYNGIIALLIVLPNIIGVVKKFLTSR